jgi:hypothetical protein
MTEIDYMDAITAITQRVSVAQLTGPGPSEQQVEQLYLRLLERLTMLGCDHGVILRFETKD